VSLTDELEKLAGLHHNGQLTDQEYASGKARLLGPEIEPPEPLGQAAPVSAAAPGEKAYRSSRWSSGNLLFPDQLTLAGDGLHFRKGTLFGTQEEHINFRAVASLRIRHGIFLSNLNIETSGGSQPIFINGLWKSDACAVQAAVQSAQSAGQR